MAHARMIKAQPAEKFLELACRTNGVFHYFIMDALPLPHSHGDEGYPDFFLKVMEALSVVSKVRDTDAIHSPSQHVSASLGPTAGAALAFGRFAYLVVLRVVGAHVVVSGEHPANSSGTARARAWRRPRASHRDPKE